MKKLFTLFCLIAMGFSFASCSDDDDAAVVLPVYDDVVFMQNGEVVSARNIVAGQEVTATLKQAKKGNYIYRYTYNWSCNDSESGLNNFPQNKQNNEESVCNFTAGSPGDYTLTINIKYDCSGNKAPKIPSVDNPKISVTYAGGGQLYANATVVKNFTIR